jgi:hypothetical protein
MIVFRSLPNHFTNTETVIALIDAHGEPLSQSDLDKCNRLSRNALDQLKHAHSSVIDFWNCAVDVEAKAAQAIKTADGMHSVVQKQVRNLLQGQMRQIGGLLDSKLDQLDGLECSVSQWCMTLMFITHIVL